MKPWFWISAERAHQLAPIALKALAAFREPVSYTWQPLTWRGLKFQNPLGLAGGVDKDGTLIEDWWRFGPGFIEIGTVTPKAQGPNQGKIIDRDRETQALWNRMGFPGSGVYAVRENLKDLPRPYFTPIFVNIGKNRTTSNEDAIRDYAECIEVLAGYADAFVVNISSPNTAGLRELLQPHRLRSFLGGVLASRNKCSHPQTPVLLKISPDLSESDLTSIVEIASGLGIDGFVATNTTLSRPSCVAFPAEGGLSGRPLAKQSKWVLEKLAEILGPSKTNFLIVSAGGVMRPNDVLERLELGANLVQVYSALIFEGPGFFKKVAHHASTHNTAKIGREAWL